jgi:hypothetical protein
MNISGFSTEALASVEQLLYGEIPWKKQFQDGKGPGPQNPENYHTGLSKKKGRGQLLISSTGVKGNLGKPKQDEPEMLSGPALEKGPGNPQSGSSKEVFGMRALG